MIAAVVDGISDEEKCLMAGHAGVPRVNNWWRLERASALVQMPLNGVANCSWNSLGFPLG